MTGETAYNILLYECLGLIKEHRLAFSGVVSSTSASPLVSPVSFICSPHLSFANHERQAAQ
eukprot:COSAG01_NODE_5315_length_4341_cov_4.952145_5_plen_60_part_01